MSSVFDLVVDILSPDRPSEGDKSTTEPGDRGDKGDNPRSYWPDAGATPGRQGATFGDPGATHGEKSPLVAPRSPQAQPVLLLGESPQSPLSPAADLSHDRPSWRWLVQHADGSWTDHTVTPPDTLAQMRVAYPDAVAFEPLFNLSPAMERAA